MRQGSLRASFFFAAVSVLVPGGAALASSGASSPAKYVAAGEIAIGGEGGWDYLLVDSDSGRLYLSHATRVVVVDVTAEKIVGEIEDTPGVHGIALDRELGKAFVSNGKGASVSVVDLATLKTLAKVPTGENPDAIVADPARHEVFAFNGKSHSSTVIDAKAAKAVAAIPLPGKPEFAAVDPTAGRVYVNIEDKSLIEAIDSSSHSVVASWPIVGCEEPSGLAIDVAHHRLFAGCHNQVVVMLDSKSGKTLSSAPIGKGVDAVAYDPGTELVFSSNGEGNVTIARVDGSGKLAVVQNLSTEHGARTMAIDLKTHKIYLPAAKFKPAKAGSRSQIENGTLKLLIFAPGTSD